MCGVLGICAPDRDVARLAHFGLHALQHRGQESAGIAVSDEGRLTVLRDLGLVAQVFNEQNVHGLTGQLAIGHNRYSTTGAAHWANSQPILQHGSARTVALGHNGNLVNASELRDQLAARGVKLSSSSDTELIAALVANDPQPLADAVADAMRRLEGAYSVTALAEGKLLAFRDPHGFRPLVLGRLPGAGSAGGAAAGARPKAGAGTAGGEAAGARPEAGAGSRDGVVVASETCALDLVGAELEREVAPGELLVVDESEVESRRAVEPRSGALCIFEFFYLARPDTRLEGVEVHAARVRMGKRLADEAPVEADLVLPIPDSGTPAAIGFSRAAGIPFSEGLIKNRYVGRTFIQPDQALRQQGIRLKFNPLSEVAGKRVVVVDDSIVRGNTTRQIVQMLFDAGASEVHVRVSSPPVIGPCFYGIDLADEEELIAAGRSVEEVRESIGATSLAYLSLEGLQAATARPSSALCRACLTGEYPTRVPEGRRLAKLRFEPVRA
jgi:amidophosphoribosyltransferase